MNRIWNYARAAVYLVIFCMPPAWALRLMMHIARLRCALGPHGNWPAEAISSDILDLKAAWRRRMFVWAHEVWPLTSGPRPGCANVCREVSVAGIEHVREAVRSGDGAIVILAHQAGIHIGWILMEAGLPWSVVAHTPRGRFMQTSSPFRRRLRRISLESDTG